MMNTRRLITTVLLGGSLLCLLGAGGRSAKLFTLFEGSFDQSQFNLSAEVGKFFAWSSDNNTVKIVQDLHGGNSLVIDDTLGNAAATVVAGGFQGYKTVTTGLLVWNFEVTFSKPNLPFAAGLVVDNPTSDFVPATGPDGNGSLIIAKKSTTYPVPVGVPLDVEVAVSRNSSTDDWEYEITLQERESDPSDALVFQGRFADTAGRSVVGFAFEKGLGVQGQVQIDDVSVVHNQPILGGI